MTATPRFAVVGEAGTGETTVSLPTDIPLHVHAFLAGSRFSVRPHGTVAVFGQVLFGSASSNAVVANIESTTTDLAIQPGGGVDVGVGPKWAVRLQGNYRVIRASAVTTKQERFLAGLVFHP